MQRCEKVGVVNTSEQIKIRDENRVVKVMIDNTKARYVRLTNLASTEVPPSKGVFSVDKIDELGNAHVGKVGFEIGIAPPIDFCEIVRRSLNKLLIDHHEALPSWLTRGWIESAPISFSDVPVIVVS